MDKNIEFEISMGGIDMQVIVQLTPKNEVKIVDVGISYGMDYGRDVDYKKFHFDGISMQERILLEARRVVDNIAKSTRKEGGK